VTVDCPVLWGAGRYSKVTVTVTFVVGGFARLTHDYPEGFNALPVKNSRCDLDWSGDRLNAVMMNIKPGEKIVFSYFVMPETGMEGSFTIQGKLVTISGSSERKEIRLDDKKIDISGTGGILPGEMKENVPGPELNGTASSGVHHGKEKKDVTYRIQLSASSRMTGIQKIRKDFSLGSEIKVYVVHTGKTYKYQAGDFSDFESAAEYLEKLKENGTKDAFIIAWSGGRQTDIKPARDTR